MPLGARDYANLLMLYGECNYNANETLRRYRETYPPPHPTSRMTILRAFDRVANNQPVVPRTGLNDQRGGGVVDIAPRLEERVLRYFNQNPRASSRQAGRRFRLTHTAVLKILKRARLHPYSIQRVQALLPRDCPVREAYCRWLLNKLEEDRLFIRRIIWSDESLFTRNGMWNRRNEHFYAEENPFEYRYSGHQYRWSVNVWAAIHGDTLIGPVFLPPTLNRVGYLALLNTELQDYLDGLPVAERREVWFQQDGAPAHSVNEVRLVLNNEFGDRWIGRFGPYRWPPRSPDLTPLDFFLWGTIKDMVYKTECDTAEEMRQRLTIAFDSLRRRNVRERIFAKVHRHTRVRAAGCIIRHGGTFEHRM